VGLRAFFGYDSGYEYLREYGSLSLENVVCCQLAVSATVQGSPNECVCCLLSVRGLCAVQGSPNEGVRCVLSVSGICDGPGES